MSTPRRLLAGALVITLATGCRGIRDLELRHNDSLPTKAGKIVLLVPVVVIGACVVVAAGLASARQDAHDDGIRPRHPDISPGRLEQIW